MSDNSDHLANGEPSAFSEAVSEYCRAFETDWHPELLQEFSKQLEAFEQNLRFEAWSRLWKIDQAKRLQQGLPATAQHYQISYPNYSGFDYAETNAQNLDATREFLFQGSGKVYSNLRSDDDDDDESDEKPQISGYQIIKELGAGGMGDVWLAIQEATQQQVALKMIRKKYASDVLKWRRFKREIQLSAKLNHDNIGRIYHAETGEDNSKASYYVMEYIPGLPLDEYIITHKCTVLECLALFRQVCNALDYSHGLKVIHRDLKPGNILVTDTGRVKVIDFGLAKELIFSDQHLTQPGDIYGTPAYSPPEQLKATGPATETADIFSLGKTLEKMLSINSDVTNPKQQTKVASKTTTGKQVPVVESHISYPQELAHIITKATAEEPAARYQSVAELVREIDKYEEALKPRKKTLWYSTAAVLGLGILVAAILIFSNGIPATANEYQLPANLKNTAVGKVLDVLLTSTPLESKTNEVPQIAVDFLCVQDDLSRQEIPLKDGMQLYSGKGGYKLKIKPITTGYLYVFQIDSLGKINWFYPQNSADVEFSSGKNPLQAEDAIQIPAQGDYVQLDDNPGNETIYAIYTANQWPELEQELAKAVTAGKKSPAIAMEKPIELNRGIVSRGAGKIVSHTKESPSVQTASDTQPEHLQIPAKVIVRNSFVCEERHFLHLPANAK